MHYMFADCSSLTSLDPGDKFVPGYGGTTDMFTGCTSLSEITLSNNFQYGIEYDMRLPNETGRNIGDKRVSGYD